MIRGAIVLAALAMQAGCGGGQEAGPPAWEIVLQVDGAAHRLPAPQMEIFLVEPGMEAPEAFRLAGESLVLVGEIPANMAVGYEEDYSKLVGKSLSLTREGGDPGEPQESFITLPDGSTATVREGTLTVQKKTGSTAGQDGDIALHGTLSIVIGDGSRTLTGTFVVHPVTWG